MKVFYEKTPFLDFIANSQRTGEYRALVPTMGALHRGHTSLMDHARAHVDGGAHGYARGLVGASIFVNPTQFGPDEDLDAYPRTLENDLRSCESAGVDFVFAPNKPEEVYPADPSITISEDALSPRHCGRERPGHFDGVCLVVAKLFHLFQAHAAVFGEKDFQQLAVIRRMVRDLDFPIDILSGATVREEDGLALSSRNAYLSAEHRALAPRLFAELKNCRTRWEEGGYESWQTAEQDLAARLSAIPEASVDYAHLVDAATLAAPSRSDLLPEDYRVLAAVRFGKTRLIDNV